MNKFFSIQKINNIKSPLRFAVEVSGKQYRIFSYFSIGNDKSIAVQDYYPANSSVMKSYNTPPNLLSKEDRVINDKNYDDEALDFKPQKFSFHKSGINNAKNKEGFRYPEDIDARSIPFSSIKDTIRLCYIYPASYMNYPVRKPNGTKHHYVFQLDEIQSKIPSMIEIRIALNNYDLIEEMKKVFNSFSVFIDSSTLKDYGITIYTVLRKSPNKIFPNHHVFISEIF